MKKLLLLLIPLLFIACEKNAEIIEEQKDTTTIETTTEPTEEDVETTVETTEPVTENETTESPESYVIEPFCYSFDLDWYDIYKDNTYINKYISFINPEVIQQPEINKPNFHVEPDLLVFKQGYFKLKAGTKEGGLVLEHLSDRENENNNYFRLQALRKTPYRRKISIQFRTNKVTEDKLQIKYYSYNSSFILDITEGDRFYDGTATYDVTTQSQTAEFVFNPNTTGYEFIPLAPKSTIYFIIEKISISDEE